MVPVILRILTTFGGVNDVISRQRVDAQSRSRAVDGNGAGIVACVTADISNGRGDFRRTVCWLLTALAGTVRLQPPPA